jgi:bilirubin oxidase
MGVPDVLPTLREPGAGVRDAVLRGLPAGRPRLEATPAFARAALLDPATIPKYVRPLVIPPAMPRTSTLAVERSRPIDYYEIAVRQFRQEILPPPFAQTTVWSYGSVNHPETFNYPAFTIEAEVDRPVRVKWINGLVDENGDALPHLLPVDPTLHWANPPGGVVGRDSTPRPGTSPPPRASPPATPPRGPGTTSSGASSRRSSG